MLKRDQLIAINFAKEKRHPHPHIEFVSVRHSSGGDNFAVPAERKIGPAGIVCPRREIE